MWQILGVLRQRLWSRVVSACPLCRGVACGGKLCGGCFNDVLATMHATQSRCYRCALRLSFSGQSCPNCTRCPPPWSRSVTAFDYESPGDLLISLYKSRGRYELAELLAALIVRAVDASAEPLPLNTVFVPIPSASTSLRRRGFNPAAELARALARQTGKPLAGDWLDRRRDGPKQSMLSRLDRLQSARQMYHCPKPIPTCTVAIVDDVMTTGSTLHAAASALQEAGAMTLIGVVAARTPLEDGGTLAQYRLP